jgi:hypothetical protein
LPPRYWDAGVRNAVIWLVANLLRFRAANLMGPCRLGQAERIRQHEEQGQDNKRARQDRPKPDGASGHPA